VVPESIHSSRLIKRRKTMDVKDYCKSMETEMTVWKAKLYDVMRKVDGLGSAEKEGILANVEDLHMSLEEMTDRVEKLKTECPSDWSPMKNEIEGGSVDMRSKYEETMEYIGKASPVSIPG
jgi:predicted nuclease with TOPRIM domain